MRHISNFETSKIPTKNNLIVFRTYENRQFEDNKHYRTHFHRTQQLTHKSSNSRLTTARTPSPTKHSPRKRWGACWKWRRRSAGTPIPWSGPSWGVSPRRASGPIDAEAEQNSTGGPEGRCTIVKAKHQYSWSSGGRGRQWWTTRRGQTSGRIPRYKYVLGVACLFVCM